MNIMRSPWTTMSAPIHAPGLSAVEDVPTVVKLSDGTSYTIPGGEKGSAAWAREASLIATAYKQVGDYANAYKWSREYTIRMAAYLRIQAGQDIQMVLDSMSWLRAPGEIIAGAKRELDKLELLLLAGVVVVGIGFFKSSLRVRV
jgi:hypothetical protein